MYIYIKKQEPDFQIKKIVIIFSTVLLFFQKNMEEEKMQRNSLYWSIGKCAQRIHKMIKNN